VPIASDQEFSGNLADLFSPYSVYVGLTVVAICVLHGSTFIALKTSGPTCERAGVLARRSAPVVALVVVGFAVWTQLTIDRGVVPSVPSVVAVMAVIGAWWLLAESRDGWAFVLTTFTMAAVILTLFADLYPRVMVSSTNSAYSLTVSGTSASSYALKLMTVVALIFLPLVLVYQSWSYHVFRRRIGVENLEPQGDVANPAAAAAAGARDDPATGHGPGGSPSAQPGP
jgi:cytochrome bd ubiquinol oxidase subunit II